MSAAVVCIFIIVYVEIFQDKKHRGYKRSKTTDLSQKSSEQLLSVDSTIGRSRSQVGSGGAGGGGMTHRYHEIFRKETLTTLTFNMERAGESRPLWSIFLIC